MAGETDLRKLLDGMRPHLNPGRYVFTTVAIADPTPGAGSAVHAIGVVAPGVRPVATVAEPEGLTLVVRQEEADAAGLAYDYVAAWITLRIHSALAAVGLTAAVSSALAEHGISCNVVAGYHHDHLFVPHDRATEALAALQALSADPI